MIQTNQTPPQKKRRRKQNRWIRPLLILLSIAPVGCLCAIFVGLSITWYFDPLHVTNAKVPELSEEFADEIVIMAAADYANTQDIQRAQLTLDELHAANSAQYVSLVAERLIRRHRGPVTEDIQNVVLLADALNVSSSAMIAYISSPTATMTPTPLPTDTPTATAVIPPTETATVTPLPTDTPEAPPTEEPATETPVPPTDTPVPVVVEEQAVVEEVAPVPELVEEVAPAAVEEPPAEESAVAGIQADPASEVTPQPGVDFVITKQRMLTKEENGGCLGMHQVFVTVVDVNGNPIQGVIIEDVWGNFKVPTGHKGADKPGFAELDMYKNGFYFFVGQDPTAGRPVTSQQTELLSTNDWEIGIPRLIKAGYCPDEGSCRTLWNSGVFGEGANSLCWGHYSWEVVFQRTW